MSGRLAQSGRLNSSPEHLRDRIEELEFELARVKRERDEISDSLVKSDQKWRRYYHESSHYRHALTRIVLEDGGVSEEWVEWVHEVAQGALRARKPTDA